MFDAQRCLCREDLIMTRSEQIIAALTWANQSAYRSAYAKTEGGKPVVLTIIESRGNDNYCVILKVEDGIDFNGLLDAKEREKDLQEFRRLKQKLEIDNATL